MNDIQSTLELAAREAGLPTTAGLRIGITNDGKFIVEQTADLGGDIEGVGDTPQEAAYAFGKAFKTRYDEPLLYDIILHGTNDQKVNTMKALRRANDILGRSFMSIRDAKDLVEQEPGLPILRDVPADMLADILPQFRGPQWAPTFLAHVEARSVG